MKNNLIIILLLLVSNSLFSQFSNKVYKVSLNDIPVNTRETLLTLAELKKLAVLQDSLLFLSIQISNLEDSIAFALQKLNSSAAQLECLLNKKPIHSESFKLEKNNLKEIKLIKSEGIGSIFDVSFKYKKKFSIYDLLIVTCVRYMFANEYLLSIKEN